jgi:hypothetical protein
VNTTGGTSTCMAAAAAAPRTKYEAACRKSCRAASVNAVHLDPSVWWVAGSAG